MGAGLKQKTEFRRPLASLIPKHLTHVNENVKSFSPETSSVTTASGRSLTYETLVVATGLQINWNGIQGLPQALSDSTSGVSSIYSYDTCDKVWADIESLRSGNAVFTQPAGVVKCAGGESLGKCLDVVANGRSQLLKKSCGWPGIGSERLAGGRTSRLISTLACPRCSVSRSTRML